MASDKRRKKRPPGYELFFAPLEVALDPKELEQTHFAYMVSKYAHAKQVRDDGGRYFDHPKGAAWIFINEMGGRDSRVIIVTLLHDVPEDAYLVSSYRIALNFGEPIALDVRSVTKLPKGKETTADYIRRIIWQGSWAILAKLLDRLHNMRTLRGRPRGKWAGQIAETRRYHLRILIPALRSYGGIWAIYADQLQKKILEAIAAMK